MLDTSQIFGFLGRISAREDRLTSDIPKMLWGRDDQVHQAVQALHRQEMTTLGTKTETWQLINGYCTICGKSIFSYQNMVQHIQTHHEEYWPDVLRSYASWRVALKGLYTPCCFCGMTRDQPGTSCVVIHDCMALLTLALADMYHQRELVPLSSRFALDAAAGDHAAAAAPASSPLMDLLAALPAE